MKRKFITIAMARKLIDFSGGDKELESLGQMQLEGAVALYNRIQQQGIGYLADEVGMGKTYVALGVVTLMRYFQPSLRVLFILPKQNILNKWYATDCPNFLRQNFLVDDYRVKNEHHNPVAKPVACENLVDLIEKVSTGYYGDFFIKMSSFSFGLSEDETSLGAKLEELKKLIPAYQIPEGGLEKERVKDEYADAINRILPWFDLVVVDEAHNFRKGVDTSARNRVLSRILGTHPESRGHCKVGKVLLLSATPFENDLHELRNQFRVFSCNKRILEELPANKDDRNALLNRFMVRRINKLQVAGTTLTRNMYRCEHRADARITLKDEDYQTKLVTALVQKKVGELIRDMRGQYQTGMLASFESYLPSGQSVEVEFDGEQEERGEAKDASLIRHLTESYQDAIGTKKPLPHPKMDKVVEKFSNEVFKKGRKQLVFVRRIKSVDDLKEKLDAAYDGWLRVYLEKEICQEVVREEILKIFDDFKAGKGQGAEENTDQPAKDEDSLEAVPANNNFFTYFFRGKFEGEAKGFPRPLTFRKYLTEKKEGKLQKISEYFEIENGSFFEKMKSLLGEEPEEKEFYRELLFSTLRLGHGFIDFYIAYLNHGSEGFLQGFLQMLHEQKARGERFSTYWQLKELHDNFPIILKTNFTGYHDEGLDLRRFIQRKLSPLEPVIGAKGGDDKSAVARKFRMPGYPMVLVSTDVLQEGEDLHTFCDSVVHYGLSASPISIEQKTGRVDRVGALAHRRLQSLKHFTKLEEIKDEGIQVYFPFLKESVEAVQVREVAKRLNEFLDSLHEFDAEVKEADVVKEESLADRSEIPPLIKKPLESPFRVICKDLWPREDLYRLDIEGEKQRILAIKKHIGKLMVPYEGVEYEITSTLSPQTLVLKIFGNEKTVTKRELLAFDPQRLYRMSIKEWKGDQLTVRKEVHLFAGDGSITQAEEIEDAIARLNGKKHVEKILLDLRAFFDGEYLKSAEFLRNHTVEVEGTGESLWFSFGIGGKPYRRQKVEVHTQQGYLVLKSRAVNCSDKKFDDEKLVDLTYRRNSLVDFVDFYLEDEWIWGRIVHPLVNLQKEEFIFYAYVLACEADRLEHLTSNEDIY